MTYDLTRFDGDQYFNEKELLKAASASPSSKELLIHMDPQDFLKAAEPLLDSSSKREIELMRLCYDGVKMDYVPYLSFDNNGDGVATGFGHEGRHRAGAMIRLGVKHMPVRFICRDGYYAIMWGRQGRGDHDRLKGIWPKVYKQERLAFPDRAPRITYHSIPFPVPDLRVDSGWISR